MGGQICVDASAERVTTDRVFDHPKHGRGFLVGDAVERRFNLVWCLKRGADRARRGHGIHPHGVMRTRYLVEVHLPFGVQCGERTRLHPGREAFVQPEVIPPLHRDQVTKPLVRHLVCDHAPDALRLRDGRGVPVQQQVGLAVEDRAGVLHGTRGKVGDGDHVELAEGVGLRKVAMVVAQNPLGRVERGRRERGLLRRGADAQRNALRGAVPTREVADGQCHEVGRHAGGRGEAQRVLVRARTRRVRDQCAIGDRRVAGGDCCAHGEGRLQRRLVEAREGTPCVGRLQLRYRVASAVCLTQIQAPQVTVERRVVAEVQRGRTLRQGGGPFEGDGLASGLPVDGGGPTVPIGGRRAGAVDRHVEGVQGHAARRAWQADVNTCVPVERAGLHVHGHMEVVVRRQRLAWQALGEGRGRRQPEHADQGEQGESKPVTSHVSMNVDMSIEFRCAGNFLSAITVAWA